MNRETSGSVPPILEEKAPLDGWRGKFFHYLTLLVIPGVLLLYYRYYWGDYGEFNRSIEPGDLLFSDFQFFYYPQAKVILESHAPLFMYYYSPTFALLLLPMTKLPMHEALSVWGWVQGLSLLLFVASGLYLLRRLKWWTQTTFLLLTLTSYPILNNWRWGQTTTLSLALVMASLAASERLPSGLRAFPLALATATRYNPGLYALPLLFRRQWSMLTWMLGLVAVLLFVVPALMMGSEATWDFYQAASRVSRQTAADWSLMGPAGSQYLPTVVARLGGDLGLGTSGARRTVVAVGYLLAVLCIAAAGMTRRFSKDAQILWMFCFIAGSTPFLIPSSWMHYFAFLPLAQTFLLSRIVDSGMVLTTRALLMGSLWIPSVGLSNIFFFNQLSDPESYPRFGFILFSDLLMLALAFVLARHELRSRLTQGRGEPLATS